MVSPLEKNGGEINGIGGTEPNNGLPEGGIVQAAADGDSITYLSLLAFPGSAGNEPQGAPIASQYLSTREVGRWSTEDITTAVDSRTYPVAGSGAPYEAFSFDLSRGLMLDGDPPPVENPPLTANAPPRYVNYYLRNDASGGFEALLTKEALLASSPVEEPSEFFMELLGVTPDLGHVVLKTRVALPPVVTPQREGNLYEWAGGGFQPINVPPGAANPRETASGGALLGMGFDEDHTISSDGSRVFWDRPRAQELFVRKNIGTAQAETIQVDASKIPNPKEPIEEGGQGEFKTASADGSKVFFTDQNRLTPGSAGGRFRHLDLYLFDVDTGQLTDLTIDGANPEGASVLGVLEASEDGSYVYFVAGAVLLPGTAAVAGGDNLYVWHEGETRFIASLSPDDNGHGGFHEPVVAHDWDTSTGDRTARVTPDGRHLLFMSDARLTGYDNAGYEEVYLYDAASSHLTCVSCNPSGARPIGPSGFPGGTPWQAVHELGTYQPHVLSEDGSRVFFDSQDALVPQDTNGAQDVYEWEQDGSGTCRREGGCVFLLSGATSTSESALVDASASGDDVFFVTRAQLVAQDTDQLRDLYDARVPHVLGETVVFPTPSPAQPCEGESCLPPASAVLGPSALASPTFSGTGNLVPAGPTPATKAKAKKQSKPRKRVKRPRRTGHRAVLKKAHRARGTRRA